MWLREGGGGLRRVDTQFDRQESEKPLSIMIRCHLKSQNSPEVCLKITMSSLSLFSISLPLFNLMLLR